MSKFVKLTAVDNIHDKIWINLDLVQEIVPAVTTRYNARLIFVGMDVEDNEQMYHDVMETPEQIVAMSYGHSGGLSEEDKEILRDGGWSV